MRHRFLDDGLRDRLLNNGLFDDGFLDNCFPDRLLRSKSIDKAGAHGGASRVRIPRSVTC